jgi:hypothetical protein
LLDAPPLDAAPSSPQLETIMSSLHAFTPRPPQVKVLFEDGTHYFLLPKGATLSELADQVEALQSEHADAPVAIHVEFDISNFWPHLGLLPHLRNHHAGSAF